MTPIGLIAHFAVTPPPARWLECNGQAISRIAYADLFRVIGETYGAGDGTTTFNLPDIRGRVIASPGTEPFNGVGSKTGEATHQLTASEIPELGISVTDDWQVAGSAKVAGSDGTTSNPLSSVVNAGGGSPHNNVQPTIIIPAVIYAGV